MSKFAQSFNSYHSVRRDYASCQQTLGYYFDNGVTRWEPINLVDMKPEKRFGPGAMTVGELDNYDWRDCEEF